MKVQIFIYALIFGLFSACNSSDEVNVIFFEKRNPCFCEKDTLINHNIISCDTTNLSNNSILYWQFNCEKIWLTLENINGQKVIIDSVPIDLYGYTYRLGFHLIKEFENSILFRSGCPANGPCSFILIDKNTGNEIDALSQLICIDNNEHEYEFDFIVYLSDTSNHLIIYNVDNGSILHVPFEEKLNSIIPEYQFYKMTLNNDVLSLNYKLDNDIEKILKVNLSKLRNQVEN